MNKYRLVLTLFVMIALMAVNGCYYDKEDELYPNGPGSNCDTTQVTYAATIQPLIANRCAIPGCHVSGAQSPNLSTYTGLVNNITRVQVRALDLKTMPPTGPISSCDISIIRKWINQGTPNN